MQMRLSLVLAACAVAELSSSGQIESPGSFGGVQRSLGKLEDAKAAWDKAKADAKKAAAEFNGTKSADKAEAAKKKLEKAESAARSAEREYKRLQKESARAKPLGDKKIGGGSLKEQVKKRAEERDKEANKEAREALEHANEILKRGKKTPGDKAKVAVDSTVKGAKKAGSRVKYEIKDAGEAMADEAIKAGNTVKAGAAAVGNVAVNSALGVKNAAKHAKTNTKVAATNVGDAIGDKATDVKNAALGGLATVGGHIKKAGENTVDGIKKVGDATHVGAVNAGDFIGDKATEIKNAMNGGLVHSFKAVKDGIPGIDGSWDPSNVLATSLGFKWWKGLIAVLCSSLGVGAFAALWEFFGPAKKNAHKLDHLHPRYVVAPEKLTETAAAPAAVTVAAPVVPVTEAVIQTAPVTQVQPVPVTTEVVTTPVETAIPVKDEAENVVTTTTTTTEPVTTVSVDDGVHVQDLKEKFEE